MWNRLTLTFAAPRPFAISYPGTVPTPVAIRAINAFDPLGFALENFDPIGAWRTKYPHGARIDASGELPDGGTFNDIAELKRVLLDKRVLFAKALTEKMFMYSLGRELGPHDRPHVDQVLRDLDRRGYGLRDLVELVATSEPFSSR